MSVVPPTPTPAPTPPPAPTPARVEPWYQNQEFWVAVGTAVWAAAGPTLVHKWFPQVTQAEFVTGTAAVGVWVGMNLLRKLHIGK